MLPETLFDRLFDRPYALVFASLLVLSDTILRVMGAGSIWELKATAIDNVITLGQLLTMVSAYFLFNAFVVSQIRYRITHIFWTPLYYLFRLHKDNAIPSSMRDALKQEFDVEAYATEHNKSILWERLEEHRKINRKIEKWSDILFSFALIVLGGVWTKNGIFALQMKWAEHYVFIEWGLSLCCAWLLLLCLKPVKRKWDFLVYLPHVSIPIIKR